MQKTKMMEINLTLSYLSFSLQAFGTTATETTAIGYALPGDSTHYTLSKG